MGRNKHPYSYHGYARIASITQVLTFHILWLYQGIDSNNHGNTIIDILAEVTKDSDLQSFKEYLTSAGYLCMSENSRRLSFNKGYTEKGFADQFQS